MGQPKKMRPSRATNYTYRGVRGRAHHIRASRAAAEREPVEPVEPVDRVCPTPCPPDEEENVVHVEKAEEQEAVPSMVQRLWSWVWGS